MKAKDLRERSADELKELEKSLSKDLFSGRLKNFTNRLDDTSLIKKARRDLARVKTLLVEQARGLTPAPAGEKPTKKAAAPTAAKAAAAPKAAAKKTEKKGAKS